MRRASGSGTDLLLDAALYLVLVAVISIGVYYLPDYYWFERLTTEGSALVMRLAGMEAYAWTVGSAAYVNEVQIVRECTGVQVIAVFSGILLPLPRVGWRRKLVTISIVSLSVYGANIVRIALELWLLYNGILPWSLAHYPLGLFLGVISVLFLVLVADRFIPEIGDYVASMLERAGL